MVRWHSNSDGPLNTDPPDLGVWTHHKTVSGLCQPSPPDGRFEPVARWAETYQIFEWCRSLVSQYTLPPCSRAIRREVLDHEGRTSARGRDVGRGEPQAVAHRSHLRRELRVPENRAGLNPRRPR